MPLELQLRRTTGTVYGEILRDSGVSLPRGKYITGGDLASGLRAHGVRADVPVIFRDMNNMTGYGYNDDVWTGIQRLKDTRIGSQFSRNWSYVRESAYFYNQWKELMMGEIFGTENHHDTYDYRKIFRIMTRNPREGVDMIKKIYALFAKLPEPVQEDFFGQLASFPCFLVNFMHAFNSDSRPVVEKSEPEVYEALLRIFDGVKTHIPKEHQHDVDYVLDLMGCHNICVGKGQLIRAQMEHLLGFDVTTIPEHWEQGHLNGRAIAEKREELNEMLARKSHR